MNQTANRAYTCGVRPVDARSRTQSGPGPNSHANRRYSVLIRRILHGARTERNGSTTRTTGKKRRKTAVYTYIRWAHKGHASTKWYDVNTLHYDPFSPVGGCLSMPDEMERAEKTGHPSAASSTGGAGGWHPALRCQEVCPTRGGGGFSYF